MELVKGIVIASSIGSLGQSVSKSIKKNINYLFKKNVNNNLVLYGVIFVFNMGRIDIDFYPIIYQ